MPVITLSRQIGSGGDDVAQEVARRLDLRLVGREIISQAARQAGVPEVALAELDELGLLGLRPRRADLALYRETVGRLMREWAAAGNAILLGRGSQVVLAAWPGVLRVRVVAPVDQRVARVQRGCGVTSDVAAAIVEARDRARAEYVRRHYRVQANDPALYDLILNMARLTVTAASDLVCAAATAVSALAHEVET